jgi:SAM-dependent methyltransferase
VARDWHNLGAADPLWAVYVRSGVKDGRWDVGDFLQSGRDEVARVFDALAEPPGHFGLAVDFGCGVGRLSQALAGRFDRVIGVDVSGPMLARARELLTEPAISDRIAFALNERDDLAMLEDSTVDLVYSSLVLQHLPRSLAASYLREFLRILRPDGIAVVQVASRPTRSAKGLAFRVLPNWLTALLQRRLLHYPAPMRMQAMPRSWVGEQVRGAGGEIVSEAVDDTYGGHWIYTRYVLRPGLGRPRRT